MEKKNWLIIVNPNAGAGKGEKDWPDIKSMLMREGFQFEAEITQRRFHAMIIARKGILDGYRKIMVVGGDGTLNEVINGIFAQSLVPTYDILLGMIPVGTGNDWARMFGISSDYHEAIELIKTNNTFLQDAGKVSFMNRGRQFKRYFVNIAGIGFDAMVASKTNQLKEKGKSHPLLYLWNIFMGLFSYKYFNASVNIDGINSTYSIFSMNVGICKYSGGGMMQVPTAIADDGRFDLTIINKIGKLGVLKSLPMLYNGTINKHPKVSTLNGKNIRIESKNEVYLETDGESLGHTPLEFEIIPGSIRVIIGREIN